MSEDNETETANNLVVKYTVGDDTGDCVASTPSGGVIGKGPAISLEIELGRDEPVGYDHLRIEVSSKGGEDVEPFRNTSHSAYAASSRGAAATHWVDLEFPESRNQYSIDWPLAVTGPNKPNCTLTITIKRN